LHLQNYDLIEQLVELSKIGEKPNKICQGSSVG
jgi:hypothetical protein